MKKFLCNPVSGLAFYRATEAAKQASTRVKDMLSSYTRKEYSRFKCYLSPTKDYGYFVKPDGEIGGLFNVSSTRGLLKALMSEQIARGGYHLDCFEPLNKLYEQHGFVTVRVEPNWDGAEFPSIHYMIYDPLHLYNVKAA